VDFGAVCVKQPKQPTLYVLVFRNRPLIKIGIT
jgi:hypothetical protein